MRIAIIGAGRIGKSLGRWAAASGYEVSFSSKNNESASLAAEDAGHGAQAMPTLAAVAAAEMIVLAVPYSAVKNVVDEVKPLLRGKILIDLTNAINADFTGLSLGFTTSAAEELAKLAPEAKVVKAFNTVFASFFDAQNPLIDGHKISVVYAGDDAGAKGKVSELITCLGFDAVDGGPLINARQIEPLGMLNILLAFKQGLGNGIGFALLR